MINAAQSSHSPSITNLIECQHDDVEIIQQSSLLHILLQYETDRVEQAVQDREQYQLILLLRAQHVEEQIHVALVDNCHAIEHNYFRICSMSLVEQMLLVRLLLFDCWKNVFVVIFRNDSVAIVVLKFFVKKKSV